MTFIVYELEGVMGRKGTKILGDYSADDLKKLAGQSKDARHVRRLLMIASILEGAERQEAAKIGNIGVQTVRDWVIRYNAGGPAALAGKAYPGRQPVLDAVELRKFKILVKADPDLYSDGVVRWRLKDLKALVWQFFRQEVCEMTVSRYLKQLGLSHISARPLHPKQEKGVIETFKKTSRTP